MTPPALTPDDCIRTQRKKDGTLLKTSIDIDKAANFVLEYIKSITSPYTGTIYETYIQVRSEEIETLLEKSFGKYLSDKSHRNLLTGAVVAKVIHKVKKMTVEMVV